jgi:hypothetical protein
MEGEGGTSGNGQEQARRRRSIAIALTLVALVVLFYLVTIVRLGGNVAKRSVEAVDGQQVVRVGGAAGMKRASA